MNTAILDRYQIAEDFEQLAANIDFPAGVWNVAAELADAGKATSPAELEECTGQNAAQVGEALERLLANKLVRQNLISWKAFAAAREKAGSVAKVVPTEMPPAKPVVPSPPPAPKSEQAVLTPPPAPKPDPAAPNGHLVQDNVAVRLGSISTPKPAVGGTNGWVWQKPEAAKVAASMPVMPAALPDGAQPNGRLLRPMLAQIENLKGGVEGQLLVYQVFLRVPYQLLHDEGIKALHLVDERTVIQNPVLHAAIVKAARDVTGVELS